MTRLIITSYEDLNFRKAKVFACHIHLVRQTLHKLPNLSSTGDLLELSIRMYANEMVTRHFTVAGPLFIYFDNVCFSI